MRLLSYLSTAQWIFMVWIRPCLIPQSQIPEQRGLIKVWHSNHVFHSSLAQVLPDPDWAEVVECECLVDIVDDSLHGDNLTRKHFINRAQQLSQEEHDQPDLPVQIWFVQKMQCQIPSPGPKPWQYLPTPCWQFLVNQPLHSLLLMSSYWTV